MMRGLIFTPDRNSPPKHPHDWEGVFLPFARRCARVLDMRPNAVVQVNLHPEIHTVAERYEARAQQVLDRLEQEEDGSLYVYVESCHGWHDGTQVVYAGARDRLAKLLAKKGKRNLRVFLAACSTADVPNPLPGPGAVDGFASKLHAELVAGGLTECWVDAHTERGHAWLGLSVVRYQLADKPTVEEWVIPRDDHAMRAKFREWLRRRGCYRMQTLSLDAIRLQVATT